MHFPAKSHNNNGESANNLWSASLAWPSQVRRMPGCQDARMQVVNVFATSLLMFIIHPICNPFGYISPENCITLSLELILRFHLSKKDVGQDEEKHQKKRGKTVSDEKHVNGSGMKININVEGASLPLTNKCESINQTSRQSSCTEKYLKIVFH